MAQKSGKRGLAANAAIFDQVGRILMVKHTYDRENWELPGGMAEVDESIVETAVREVREETGLHVAAQHTTGIYYMLELDLLVLVFMCHTIDGGFEALNPDNDEISACAFWSLDALPRPISDFTIRRINDAAAGVRLPLPSDVPPRQWFF